MDQMKVVVDLNVVIRRKFEELNKWDGVVENWREIMRELSSEFSGDIGYEILESCKGLIAPFVLTKPLDMEVPASNLFLNRRIFTDETGYQKTALPQFKSSENALQKEVQVTAETLSDELKGEKGSKWLRKLLDEVSDGDDVLEEEAEKVVLELADDFIHNVMVSGCTLAKHSKSASVSARDMNLYRSLEFTEFGFGVDGSSTGQWIAHL
ncbi:hypothetical protein BC829DRAFT_93219 [Chytridium lagenaria]|nr:hypothetical protein BC829DRAFT_93219 [Chytridium lagenaria]